MPKKLSLPSLLQKNQLNTHIKIGIVIWIVTIIIFGTRYFGVKKDTQPCLLSFVDPFSEEASKFWRPKDDACNRTCEILPLREGLVVAGNKLVVVNETLCPSPRSYYQIITDKQRPILSRVLSFDEEVMTDFMYVKCKNATYYVTYPKRKDQLVEARKKLLKQNNHPHINILGIGFDSMSHANMIRNIPKTLNFLKSRLNQSTLFELNGYNIVGDGTTQNVGGILFGYPEESLHEARTRVKSAKHIDDWPWVWKTAASNGYITAFIEDEPNIGIFTLRLKGFKTEPTDHYMNPFWKAVWKKPIETPCHNGIWDWERQLNYVLDMYSEYSDIPKFIVTFSKISHTECLSELMKFDDRLLAWFEKVVQLPGFKDTFFFLFGDHGQRFGSFRQTLQGKIEERLPAMYIKIPDWFPNVYPEHTENLRINQNKLTTPFTMYGTLQHLLHLPALPKLENFQKSFFTTLPHNRNCEDANIDDHWCSCKRKSRVQIDTTVVQGTLLLVKEINSRLKEHGEGSCHEVDLSHVRHVEAFGYNKKLVLFSKTVDMDGRKPKFNEDGSGNSGVVEYQVQFELTPGGGILEGDFKVLEDGKIEIGMHFSRVNEYGEQVCNPKPLIREFCVCVV